MVPTSAKKRIEKTRKWMHEVEATKTAASLHLLDEALQDEVTHVAAQSPRVCLGEPCLGQEPHVLLRACAPRTGR